MTNAELIDASRECGNNGRCWKCPSDEHGDLIDRTLLYADLVGVILSHSGLNFSEVIARQNAVIAAERGEHGTTAD